MDTNIHSQIHTLSKDLSTLETALSPLLTTALSTLSPPLPLLSKAKLYALSSYAINSLLFNQIRLAGQDAKEHAVFGELVRVKSYFEKIKKVEDPEPEGGEKPALRVDKEAARRFVVAGLAGDEEGDKKKRKLVNVEDGEAGGKKRKKNKKNRDGEGRSHKHKSSKPPKGPKEALQSLLDRSNPAS